MILDVEKFVRKEQPYWTELEDQLQHLRIHGRPESLEAARRLHYLYQRVISDLAKVRTHTTDASIEQYLELLVAQAYAEVHEVRTSPLRFHPVTTFTRDFPRAVRKYAGALAISLFVALLGAIMGMVLFVLDPDVKQIMPFGHAAISPSERVAEEEEGARIERLEAHMGAFSAHLMANNIRVSILTLCAGITFGLGSVVLIFLNCVILGLIALEYILDGQTVFLLGWLLPHGSIELPAIFLAGQGGIILGNALAGYGTRQPLRARLRETIPDLMVIVYGVAVMLVWAGIIEAFFSQYHEPYVPYAFKITFGLIELTALGWFLLRAGHERSATAVTGLRP